MDFITHALTVAVQAVATATALLSVLHTLRALIPATIVSIDGKPVIWLLIVLASMIASAQVYSPQTATTQFVLFAVSVSGFGFLIDAGVASSQIRDTLRTIVTLGGRTNPV